MDTPDSQIPSDPFFETVFSGRPKAAVASPLRRLFIECTGPSAGQRVRLDQIQLIQATAIADIPGAWGMLAVVNGCAGTFLLFMHKPLLQVVGIGSDIDTAYAERVFQRIAHEIDLARDIRIELADDACWSAEIVEQWGLGS